MCLKESLLSCIYSEFIKVFRFREADITRFSAALCLPDLVTLALLVALIGDHLRESFLLVLFIHVGDWVECYTSPMQAVT
jgi:hypothetical protein